MNKIPLINPEIEKYAEEFSDSNKTILNQIKFDTSTKLRYSDMLSGNQVSGLLSLLIKISNAVNIAEIGVFTGFSTLMMAESLPDHGKLYCLEMNKKYLDIALPNLRQSASYNKIHILEGNAREKINELPNNLDLFFLDADKDYYATYYEVILSKLKSGGIIIADNVFWHGGVLDAKKDRKSSAIHEFNELVFSDKRVESVMLTVRDGISIIRKK
ncbi:MAG TPA: O-methyltransferase [Bacteroidetes bacterium]|nr:O-methyltransferase [Bacteroidota bacterium]